MQRPMSCSATASPECNNIVKRVLRVVNPVLSGTLRLLAGLLKSRYILKILNISECFTHRFMKTESV